MNNQPKIEAYKSFYQQAKDYYNAGDISAARDAFLKAAELANDISVHATSYDVKMEYHKLAVKIVEFVKKECVHKKRLRKPFPKRTVRKASLYASRKKNPPMIRRLRLPTLQGLMT